MKSTFCLNETFILLLFIYRFREIGKVKVGIEEHTFKTNCNGCWPLSFVHNIAYNTFTYVCIVRISVTIPRNWMSIRKVKTIQRNSKNANPTKANLNLLSMVSTLTFINELRFFFVWFSFVCFVLSVCRRLEILLLTWKFSRFLIKRRLIFLGNAQSQ